MISLARLGWSLSVVLGVVTLGFTNGLAIARPTSLLAGQHQLPLANGLYLFGESPQPQQIGRSYIVFEVHDRKVYGALYLANSSFDCFRGTVGDRQLQVTVLPTYEEEPYPAEIDLPSFYSLRPLSASDRAILAACKAEPLPIATQTGS
ncbi:hypothetical protein [Thermosynechococcus vestitus]|uniref:Tll1441 protein n=1 Tax=Thermosynechococcus vestitus (strain NIES-2133 / IAM M-273 / BP-1) TaxID=197221 RepID=Q8DIZ0_THEVB|nr:hypothetical protein [Thermosynechococcus vestitus]BAC08993.1 tll1441 [Thermosynechococcus vestitus BP-1]BAY51305.1 hypothetical protein NIES2134_111070 [Thermostichus vulcanus NIES-2134]